MPRSAKSPPGQCPLTTSPRKRAAAVKLTAGMEDAFPPGVGQPALRAFSAMGYRSLDDVARAREADLAKLHGVGPKSIRILREALRKAGKSFAS